jgi:hypothetical protein
MSVEMLSRIIRPLILDQRFSFKLGKAEHESGTAVTSTWERHSSSQKETRVPFYRLCSMSVVVLPEHVESRTIMSKMAIVALADRREAYRSGRLLPIEWTPVL